MSDHRQALVERLKQRDTEPFVLAGAEKNVGDVVEGNQLGICDLTNEIDIGCAQSRGEVVEHCQVIFESCVRADDE